MKRTREQVIWDFVQSWLRKAEGDLRAAERLLEIEQEDYFAVEDIDRLIFLRSFGADKQRKYAL